MTCLREKRDNAYHSNNAKLQAGGAHISVPGACYLGRQAYYGLEHARAYSLRDRHLRLRLRLARLQTGHGFRGLASTIMNEQSGFRSEVIELQLAHRDLNKARCAYNHAMYLDERKKLMQWWSNYLDEQLEKAA